MPGLPAPLAPPYVWTGTGNYPAGANLWDGQPLALQPAGTYFTPNTKPSPEEFNFLLAGYAAQLVALQGYIASFAALNWTPQCAISTMPGSGANAPKSFLDACWNAALGEWFVAINSVASTRTVVYSTSGQDWTTTTSQVGSTFPFFDMASLACSWTGDVWMATSYNDGVNQDKVNFYHYTSGAWSAAETISLSPPNASVTRPRLKQFTTSAGVECIIYAIGNTSTAGHGTGYNPIGSNRGGTFAGGAIDPGGLANDFVIATNAPAVGVHQWNVAPIAIVMPRDTNVASYYLQYQTTSDCITWTQRTFPGVNTAAAYVKDIVWTQDVTGPCFLAAVYAPGSNTTIFYRSADGISWYQGATVSAFPISEMEACGALIVATLQDNGSGGGSSTAYSTDGGATWHPATGSFTTSATDNSYMRPMVRTNNTGFVMMNNNWLRFSANAGQPPATY